MNNIGCWLQMKCIYACIGSINIKKAINIHPLVACAKWKQLRINRLWRKHCFFCMKPKKAATQ